MKRAIEVPPLGWSQQSLSRLLTGVVRHGFDHGPVPLTELVHYFAGSATRSELIDAVEISGSRQGGATRLVMSAIVGGGVVVRANRR